MADGISKTKLFLAAYDRGFDRLESRKPTATRSGLPAREERRQVEDATQLQLYLTTAELAVIDDQAAKLGLSRSALVETVFAQR